MESPIPALDNREFALLAWVVLIVAAALLSRSIRESLGGVLEALFHWKILLTVGFMLAWVGVLLLLLTEVNLWTSDLVSETVYWLLFTGVVVLVRAATAGSDQGFFKKFLASSVGPTAVSEFFINLRPMGLVLELLLVPTATILSLTAVVAGTQDEYRQARTCLEISAAVVGLGLASYTVVGLFTDPESLLTNENFLELVVPVLLTIGLLPFLYCTALLVTYGSLFGHLNWKLADNKDARRYAKRRAVQAAYFRLSRANQLSQTFHWRLVPPATREEVDRALRETLESG